MSRGELIKLRANVDKALASVAERERKAALDAAERAVAEHGFTLAELTGLSGRKNARGKAKSAPKYRNPANADETWSGRGRKPGWVRDLEAAGKSIADCAI